MGSQNKHLRSLEEVLEQFREIRDTDQQRISDERYERLVDIIAEMELLLLFPDDAQLRQILKEATKLIHEIDGKDFGDLTCGEF